MHYWAAPKPKGPGPASLDEVDPEIRATSRSSASPSRSRSDCPVWPWTPSWTRCPWPRHSRRSSRRRGHLLFLLRRRASAPGPRPQAPRNGRRAAPAPKPIWPTPPTRTRYAASQGPCPKSVGRLTAATRPPAIVQIVPTTTNGRIADHRATMTSACAGTGDEAGDPGVASAASMVGGGLTRVSYPTLLGSRGSAPLCGVTGSGAFHSASRMRRARVPAMRAAWSFAASANGPHHRWSTDVANSAYHRSKYSSSKLCRSCTCW